MVELKNKRIYIDGKPQLIMAGEIHYFRLKKYAWQDRINKLKKAGLNCVSTYIPWICHETKKRDYDFTGKYREEHDLSGFLDLCIENGLYIFVRPGPFIMAEMKNEGLPFWIYEDHPEIKPVTWDGKPVTTRTVDYLAPAFLAECRQWYKAVMEIIVPRLYTNGGKIIAIQLDNEIGMLSWVSNFPDLTENVIADFCNWLEMHYGEALKSRYNFDVYDRALAARKFRSPDESFSLRYMHDLGLYMRYRFARYADILCSYAREAGVAGVPFVINIHGTSGGRGFTFPIGISQLYESFAGKKDFFSGTDIYLGDLTMVNFVDLYLINAFTDAMNSPDQPLTSVEFEAGDGNYNDGYGQRYDISSVDFKMRMCIAQNNRFINYYLFAGGYNYRFSESLGDWNDRIAFTGEKHGFAAPVGPDGELNYTFEHMAEGIHSVMAAAHKLADMDEDRDGVAFGFIPDYFMTEYVYPQSEKMRDVRQSLERIRAYGSWEATARAMLLLNFRFGSLDIQNRRLTPEEIPALVLPSAKYMHSHVQKKLVDYIAAGGKLLLCGELPQYDMEGVPCSILTEAIGVEVKGFYTNDRPFHYLTIKPVNAVSHIKETITGFAQAVRGRGITPLIKIYANNDVCAFEKNIGKGRVIAILTPFVCNLEFYRLVFDHLGVKPSLSHDFESHGLFMSSASNKKGERFIHILNLDGFDKEFHVYQDGLPLFDNATIFLPARRGVMLPLNLTLDNGVKIVSSTLELASCGSNSLTFKLTGRNGIVILDRSCRVKPSPSYYFYETNRHVIVILPQKTYSLEKVTIYFDT